MADHLAEQLLDALIPALTGLSTTGARVNRNPPDDEALPAASLPALLVHLGAEDVETSSLDPVYAQRRDQQIRIGIRVAATSNADQTLNQIRKEVEVTMAAGITVAGKLLMPIYGGTLEAERDGQGETPVTAAELGYTFTYFTLSDAPDAFA